MQTTLTTEQANGYVQFGFRLPHQDPMEWAEDFTAAGGTRCVIRPAAGLYGLEVMAEGSPEALALVERTLAGLAR